MKKKKKRISKWEKIQGDCNWIEPCDCGKSTLCYHPDGEVDECEKNIVL
jgi:hypothetical protein